MDPNPIAGETIVPRNYGRGPGSIRVNLRLSRTFGFGPAREGAAAPAGGPGGGPRMPGGIFSAGGGFGGMAGGTPVARRFSLTASISAQNLLNHNNPGPIIGNISSPLFGQANQAAGGGGGGGFIESANNRRLELQLRLTF